MNKEKEAYKTIGEVAKLIGLIDSKKGTPSTHTIRFWEKEFKQIRPKIFAGKRRFYDNNTIEIITNIKYLLKDKGMTIKGVKKMLNNPTSLSLDEDPAYNVNTSTIDKKKIKIKVNKIINILKELNKFKDG